MNMQPNEIAITSLPSTPSLVERISENDFPGLQDLLLGAKEEEDWDSYRSSDAWKRVLRFLEMERSHLINQISNLLKGNVFLRQDPNLSERAVKSRIEIKKMFLEIYLTEAISYVIKKVKENLEREKHDDDPS